MKKLITLFLFSACEFLQSQSSFNRAFHEYNERTNPFVISIGNELYVSTRTGNANGGNINYLYNYNVSGDLTFRIAYGYGETTVGYVTPDCLLALAGTEMACTDVGPFNSTNLFARRVNQFGTIVWSATTPTVDTGTPLTHFASFSDGTGGIFTDDRLFLYDTNGNLDTIITFPNTTIHCGLTLAGDQVILSLTQSGNQRLVLMNKTGSVLATSNVLKPYVKLKACFNQCILGRNDEGKLDKFSPSLNLVSQGSNSITDFDVLEGSVATISQSGNLVSYKLLDTTLAQVHASTFSAEHYTAVAVGLYSSEVCIAGYGESTISNFYVKHHYSAVRKFPKNGSALPSADVGLTNVTLNAGGVVSFQNHPFSQAGVAIAQLQPKITVKNNGTSTINSVKLNMCGFPGMSCGLWVYQEEFRGLSIQPGNSAVLTSTSQYVATVSDATLGATVPFDYCFYLSVPNDGTDGVFSNNEKCAQFQFLITDLPKQTFAGQLRIFPNPANEMVEVENDMVIERFEIYSADGKMLVNNERSQPRITINLNEFNSGVYLLKIFSNGEVHTRKLVKE